MLTSLHATVLTIEGDQVTLSCDDGQLVKLPLAACEGMPKVGSQIRLWATVLGSEDAGRQDLARELLNEILLP